MRQKYNDIDPDFKEVIEKNYLKIKILFVFIIVSICLGVVIFYYHNYLGSKKEQENYSNKIENSENIEDFYNDKDTNLENSSKEHNKEEIIDATKEYYCMDGYQLEGIECIKTYTIAPVVKYTCEEGRLSDKNCIIEIKEYGKVTGTKNDMGSLKMSCEDGYILEMQEEGMVCYKITTTTKPAISSYSCISEYTLSGNECIQKVSNSALYKYSCISGYTLYGTKCHKD